MCTHSCRAPLLFVPSNIMFQFCVFSWLSCFRVVCAWDCRLYIYVNVWWILWACIPWVAYLMRRYYWIQTLDILRGFISTFSSFITSSSLIFLSRLECAHLSLLRLFSVLFSVINIIVIHPAYLCKVFEAHREDFGGARCLWAARVSGKNIVN